MHYRYLIDSAVRMHADRTAAVFAGESRTFACVHDRACRLANGLLELGLHPGDRVLVLLPNCIEYMEVDIGLARCGLVRVSLNTRAGAEEQRQVLEDSAPRALIYSAHLEDTAAEILREDAAGEFSAVVRVDGDASIGDILGYEELLSRASGEPPTTDPAPDSLYCLFYTSGTTGRPKGVMLSHRAYIAVAMNLLLEFGPVRPGEKILLTQPLSHGGGFFMLPWLISGATCVIMERFEPQSCLALAESQAIETLKLVPTMLLQLLSEGAGRHALPALRQVIYGASPMPAEQLGELVELYGGVFAQLYGQAEAPMSITVLTPDDHLAGGKLLTSAGRPWRGIEVRVVDEEGRDVPPGNPGEILVRGPQTMHGYWQRPDLTRAVLRDNYVHTRDMAHLDERGYVYLLGRTDEMVISGGFNIAPRVVEEALNRHPAILESAVMGVPHPTLGQQVAAFVTLRPGSAALEEQLIEYARTELGYQKPRTLRILPELPRNAYGKVAARELLEMAQRDGR